MRRGDDYVCVGRKNCCTKVRQPRDFFGEDIVRKCRRRKNSLLPWRMLDETGFLERQKRSALLHRLESFCRYADSDLLAEFRNEKSLGLEIHLAAALARRVEFGRTDAVGVPAAYL